MKLSFKDELALVKENPTHRRVKKFLKKRKLAITLVVSNKGNDIFYFVRHKVPYCIKVPRPVEDPNAEE